MKLPAAGLFLCLGLAGWASVAGAQLFSSTGPVIAIFQGSLLVGEATGHLGGWGTLALRSPSKPGLTCVGEFSTTDGPGDSGQLRCSDGTTAPFRFQRLTLMRGYGAGSSSASTLSFTYGLSAEESISYLKLPPGKELKGEGNNLELVAAVPLRIR
jgi:hypothetical protein